MSLNVFKGTTSVSAFLSETKAMTSWISTVQGAPSLCSAALAKPVLAKNTAKYWRQQDMEQVYHHSKTK